MGVIRFILALAVVVAHSAPVMDFTFIRLVDARTAVQLFYAISGFYMALVLDHKYVGSRSYRTFLVSRYLRLAPSYFVVCILTALFCLVVAAYTGNVPRTLDYWMSHGSSLHWTSKIYLALSNVFFVGQDGAMFLKISPESGLLCPVRNFYLAKIPAYKFLLVPQAWTLGLEMSFYILAPFILRRSNRMIVALLACSFLIRIAMRHWLGFWSDPWTYRFFPSELCLFLSGSLAYRAYRSSSSRFNGRPVFSWCVFALFVTILFFRQLSSGKWLNAYINQILGLNMVSVLLPFALPWIFAVTRKFRYDNYIAAYSYPVYISHTLVIMFLKQLGIGASPLEVCVWAIVGVLVLSALLVTLVEYPFDSFRHRYTEKMLAEQPRAEI